MTQRRLQFKCFSQSRTLSDFSKTRICVFRLSGRAVALFRTSPPGSRVQCECLNLQVRSATSQQCGHGKEVKPLWHANFLICEMKILQAVHTLLWSLSMYIYKIFLRLYCIRQHQHFKDFQGQIFISCSLHWAGALCYSRTQYLV